MKKLSMLVPLLTVSLLTGCNRTIQMDRIYIDTWLKNIDDYSIDRGYFQVYPTTDLPKNISEYDIPWYKDYDNYIIKLIRDNLTTTTAKKIKNSTYSETYIFYLLNDRELNSGCFIYVFENYVMTSYQVWNPHYKRYDDFKDYYPLEKENYEKMVKATKERRQYLSDQREAGEIK